jgi:homocysteine S-methyltransferase
MEHRIAFLDGGMGTTLEDEHKIVFSSDTPLWSSHLLISAPSILKQVHSDFVAAGADIVLTATYQASFEGYSKTNVNSQAISDDDAERYMLSAVSLARSAFNSRTGRVALSLGAYGATMTPSTEYSGAYGLMTESDLLSFHRRRLEVFLNAPATWADVDILAFETLPRLDEVRAVRRLASLVPPHQRKPYWISCVFPGTDENLPDGSSISELVEILLSNDNDHLPFAIGVNCTKVQKLSGLIKQFEKSIHDAGFSFPSLAIYPDGASNQVYDTQRQKWLETDMLDRPRSRSWDAEVVDVLQEVLTRNRWKGILVGGCCKTTPTHIARLRQRVDSASF